MAGGTSVVVRVVVVVVGVVPPAAEGQWGATTLSDRRLALAEEPLYFLLRCMEGRLGQR